MADNIYTIENEVSDRIKVKGSSFIAHIFPAESVQEIDTKIVFISRKYHDATHHCFAYRIGTKGDIFKSSDDGEPKGTAGAPILALLKGRELTNLCAIVTRYFGGTKLGKGGLIRAYTDVIKVCLDRVKVHKILIVSRIIIVIGHEFVNSAITIICKFGGRVFNSYYSKNVKLIADIPDKNLETCINFITEASKGRAKITVC